jgi:MFS family permease
MGRRGLGRPATLLTGLAMGAEIDLISYLVARYYGLAYYGRIYGWLYAVFMVGRSLGPLLAGAAFDRFGNYQVATAILGVSLAVAALFTWRLPRFDVSSGVRSEGSPTLDFPTCAGELQHDPIR